MIIVDKIKTIITNLINKIKALFVVKADEVDTEVSEAKSDAEEVVTVAKVIVEEDK